MPRTHATIRFTISGETRTVALDGPRFTIGRDVENSLCLTDSVVSRFHAEFVRLGDDVLLRDLGSTNGSFVNDERVSEHILADGDVVRLGKAGPELAISIPQVQVAASAGMTPRTPDSLLASLSDKLAATAGDPVEDANLRIVLAESHLNRGAADAALDVLAVYADAGRLDALPPEARASVGLQLGRARSERKEYEAALDQLRAVLAYAARAGDEGLLSNAQSALGHALTGEGDLFGARDAIHRALLGARRAGNARLRAEAHLQLGRIDWKEGDLDAARFEWSRGAKIAEGTNDDSLQARARLQQAFVLYVEGRMREAAEAYENVVQRLRDLGNTRLLLKAFSTLSRILTRLGSWTQTDRLLEERLSIARTEGLTRAEAVALTDLAELRLLQGNADAARNVIATSLERHGAAVYARTQRILGRILSSLGRHDEAIAALETGLAAAERKGSLEEEILIGIELSQATLAAGRLADARAWLARAEGITPLDPALNLMARAIFARGRLLAAEGQPAEAGRSFSQALSIFQTIEDPYRAAQCHAEIGALRAAAGRSASARGHFEEAEQAFARLGAAADVASVQRQLASRALSSVAPAMTRTLSQTAPLSMANIPAATLEQLMPTFTGPSRILVAEADDALAHLLARGLEVENYRVERVTDGKEALARLDASREAFELVLLDALLEHKSGFDVCREARAKGLETPIVLLGARQGVEDKIEALQSGADDFIAKRGLVFEELLAKMEALLR